MLIGQARNLFGTISFEIEKDRIIANTVAETISGGSPFTIGSSDSTNTAITLDTETTADLAMTINAGNKIRLPVGETLSGTSDYTLQGNATVYLMPEKSVILESGFYKIHFDEYVPDATAHVLKKPAQVYLANSITLGIGSKIKGNFAIGTAGGSHPLTTGQWATITDENGRSFTLKEGDKLTVGDSSGNDTLTANTELTTTETGSKITLLYPLTPTFTIPAGSSVTFDADDDTNITLPKIIQLEPGDEIFSASQIVGGTEHVVDKAKIHFKAPFTCALESGDTFNSSEDFLGGIEHTLQDQAVASSEKSVIFLHKGDQVLLPVDNNADDFTSISLTQNGAISMTGGGCLELHAGDKIIVPDNVIIEPYTNHRLTTKAYVLVRSYGHRIESNAIASEQALSDGQTSSTVTSTSTSNDQIWAAMESLAKEDSDFRNKLISIGVPDAETWIG